MSQNQCGTGQLAGPRPSHWPGPHVLRSSLSLELKNKLTASAGSRQTQRKRPARSSWRRIGSDAVCAAACWQAAPASLEPPAAGWPFTRRSAGAAGARRLALARARGSVTGSQYTSSVFRATRCTNPSLQKARLKTCPTRQARGPAVRTHKAGEGACGPKQARGACDPSCRRARTGPVRAGESERARFGLGRSTFLPPRAPWPVFCAASFFM